MGVSYNNDAIVTDGLVLCLDAADPKSYNGSGTTWFDRVNESNTTLINSPTYVNDSGDAINFNQSNDYAPTPWGANVNPYNNPISISCWFKINALQSTRILFSTGQNRGNGDFNQRLYFGSVTTTRFGWGIQGSFWASSEITKPIDTNWHNVTIVIDSVNARCYIDTILEDTKAVNSSYVLNDNLWLGAHNSATSNNINARIANLHVYEKALTTEEIQQNYNATKGRFEL